VTGFTAIVVAFNRLLVRYGDPKVSQIRAALSAYAESIVQDKWPCRRPRKSVAAGRFATLSRSIMAVDPYRAAHRNHGV
jgi:hypothetical protein